MIASHRPDENPPVLVAEEFDYLTDDDTVADACAGKSLGRILLRDFGEIRLNFFQGFPGVIAAVEEGGVFGLREVK